MSTDIHTTSDHISELAAEMIALGALVVCLLAANFINPLYPFPFENNLVFANFTSIEQEAAMAVEDRGDSLPGGGRVATVFPVGDGLRNSDFGFVQRPRRVVEMNDFSAAEVAKVKDDGPDMVVVYRREWDPLHLLERPAVSDFLQRYYGYKPELRAEEIAGTLSMRIARRWTRGGLSMELLERYPAGAYFQRP